MPKRSNKFQKLIRYIAEEISPLNARVEESCLLKEKGIENPQSREVDILIEINTGVTILKIAMECRDRNRKDDVQWIDGLIGKYTNLDVNKIIAISNSGFSQTAIEKAELNNIETISLEEALKTDWPKVFRKLGIAIISQKFLIDEVIITTEPKVKDGITLNSVLLFDSSKIEDAKLDQVEGYVNITVKELIEYLYPKLVEEVKDYLRNDMGDIYKNLSDFNKPGVFYKTYSPDNYIYLDSEDDKKYCLKVIKIIGSVQSKYSKLKVTHKLFSDKALISTANLPSKKSEISLSAVQLSDKSEIKLFTENKN